jgi:hypothetical protein
LGKVFPVQLEKNYLQSKTFERQTVKEETVKRRDRAGVRTSKEEVRGAGE